MHFLHKQRADWDAGRASPEVAVDGRVLPTLPTLLGGDAESFLWEGEPSGNSSSSRDRAENAEL